MSIRRAAGYCFVGTGLLAVVGFIVHPHDSTSGNQVAWLIGHSLIFFGLVLNLVGLSWLFAVVHEDLGKLGWTGFIFGALGLSLYIGKLYWSGLHYPFVLEASPDFVAKAGLGPGSEPQASAIKIVYNAGALLFSFGHLMFGIAMLKAADFPRKPVFMMMAGAFLVGIWPLLPGLLQMLSIVVSAIYATGLVWLGISMIRGGVETRQS